MHTLEQFVRSPLSVIKMIVVGRSFRRHTVYIIRTQASRADQRDAFLLTRLTMKSASTGAEWLARSVYGWPIFSASTVARLSGGRRNVPIRLLLRRPCRELINTRLIDNRLIIG